MPELPEVETTRRGIEPHVTGRTIRDVVVRQRQLRWPVTRGIGSRVAGSKVACVCRRGKYLLLGLYTGKKPAGKNAVKNWIMIHLGMSGSLRICSATQEPRKHDHVDIVFGGGTVLRFHDPRRFGSVFCFTGSPEQQTLLKDLGPEPLGNEFTADYLYERSRSRKVAVKNFIMDSKVVVGVGNIYANEALFMAGIRPSRRASTLSRPACERLVACIRQVLGEAVKAGGTTLRDFVSAEGKPGYFSQSLLVYGRAGEPCKACGKPLKETRQCQRSTVFCPECQK